MLSKKIILLAILNTILTTSLLAAEPHAFYPTKESAEKFLESNCRGFFVRMGLTPEKRPRLLNSCLLFSIIADKKSETQEYIDKGASLDSSWPENPKALNSAFWPNEKDGTVPDETDSSYKIGSSLGSLLGNTFNRELRRAGIDTDDRFSNVRPNGLGFNAVTLAIETNNMDVLKAIIDKNPSSLSQSDSFARCPLIHAQLKNNKAAVELIKKSNRDSQSCSASLRINSEQTALLQKYLTNTEGKSILLDKTTADWLQPMPLDLTAAMIHSKNFKDAVESMEKGAELKVVTAYIASKSDEKSAEEIAKLSSPNLREKLFTSFVSLRSSAGIKGLEKGGRTFSKTDALDLMQSSSSELVKFAKEKSTSLGISKDELLEANIKILESSLAFIKENQAALKNATAYGPSAETRIWLMGDNAELSDLIREEKIDKIRKQKNNQFIGEWNENIARLKATLSELTSSVGEKSLDVAAQKRIINAVIAGNTSDIIPFIYDLKINAELLGTKEFQALVAKGGEAFANKYIDKMIAANNLKAVIQFAKNYKIDRSAVLNKILATNPSKETIDELDLIHLALSSENNPESKEIYKKLIARGADLNKPNASGVKPIEAVILNTVDGDEALKESLDAGMIACGNSSENIHLITLASMLGKIQHALLLNEAALDNKPQTMYESAIALFKNSSIPAGKLIDAMKSFKLKGLDATRWIHDGNKTLLMEAVSNRCDPELTEYLLNEGFKASKQDDNYLSAADHALTFTNMELTKESNRCSDPTFTRSVGRCTKNVQLLVNAGSPLSVGNEIKRRCRQ